MNPALDYLVAHWLALALVVGGVGWGAILLWRRRRVSFAAALVLAGVGGLLLPTSAGAWVAGLALATLFLMVSVVVLTGRWWAPLGYVAGAAVLVGLGAWAGPLGRAVVRAGRFLSSLDALQPWWLLLLLLLPVVVWLSFRSLAGLGPVRRWLAIGLRCLLITFLALALAETHARHHNDSLTVIFLWDRSFSMPREIVDAKDVSEERLRKFINDAVALRGPRHAQDRAGVIVFGRQPRLELPPASVPELHYRKFLSPVDETYTDIAAALKLALASFPEGTGKRIVLLSDGNQNLGNAEEQARVARQNGVQIDVVPVTAGRLRQQEVLVERVEAPPVTEKASRLPIRIVLKSFHPQAVVGTLRLTKVMGQGLGLDDLAHAEKIREERVWLQPGLNAFSFTDPGGKSEDSFTYEAVFIPLWVETAAGRKIHDGLPGDRIENNRASATVVARGQRNVLLIEPKSGEHELLVKRLQKAKSSLKVVAVEPGRLPAQPDQLALVLSKFDCVILANLPAETLSEAQQQVLRSNTHDQGSGLIMIGGPQGFGAGGWQGTEVEKALPVTCDLKAIKVEGKNGLVLIMHASEIADGNMWQKKIASLAINKLNEVDMVGVVHYGLGAGGHEWQVPFQQIGKNRGAILRLLDSMEPTDMMDAEPPLRMAHDALAEPKHNLSTKHIIFVSDGDHWGPPVPLLQKIKGKKISLTTVCITSHGNDEYRKMELMARMTGGRSYPNPAPPVGRPLDPKQLPEIYLKESRLISKAFVFEGLVKPLHVPEGPTVGLPRDLGKELGPLGGFVRTSRRPSALVAVPIETQKIDGYEFPLLAYWHYGLGKAVAFTSDARTFADLSKGFWDLQWATSQTGLHGKLWEQVVDWALRAVETGQHLTVTTEQRDGKVKVIVKARDKDRAPLVDVDLRGAVTAPAGRPDEERRPELHFEQKNSGVYEAEFNAEDVGSYFIHVKARWTKDGKEMSDSARTGVTIPYSPEFAEMETNPELLGRLRDLTGGLTIADDADALTEAARSGAVFRPQPAGGMSLQPIWHWLVLLAGLGLLLDVAVRRIALEPARLVATAGTVWERLRGRAVAAASPQFLDRLKSRKAQVEEARDRSKATRRFEGSAAPPPPPEAVGPTPPPASRPASPPPPPPAKEEPGDFASRLLRAKKRVWKDKDKEQGPDADKGGS
jgi:uncharacterized membrane protein